MAKSDRAIEKETSVHEQEQDSESNKVSDTQQSPAYSHETTSSLLPIYSKPITGPTTWQHSRDRFDEHVPSDWDAKRILERVHADFLKGPVILDLFMYYTERQIFEVWQMQGSCGHRSTLAKRKARMLQESGETAAQFRARVRRQDLQGTLPEPDLDYWASPVGETARSAEHSEVDEHVPPKGESSDDTGEQQLQVTEETTSKESSQEGTEDVNEGDEEESESDVENEVDADEKRVDENKDMEEESSDEQVDPGTAAVETAGKQGYDSDDSGPPRSWSTWSIGSWMSTDEAQLSHRQGTPQEDTDDTQLEPPSSVARSTQETPLDAGSWLDNVIADENDFQGPEE